MMLMILSPNSFNNLDFFQDGSWHRKKILLYHKVINIYFTRSTGNFMIITIYLLVFEKKSKRNYLTHKWHVVFFPMWPTRQPHGIEIQRRPWTNILEWYVFCLIAAHAYYRFNRGMYSLLLHNGYWWKQKQSRRKTTSSECQAHRLEV